MTSTEEHEAEKGHSVYDFIYVDRDRISLLLSQLNNFGEITSISEGKEAGRSSGKSEDFEMSGDVVVASGSGKLGNSSSAHHGKSIERTYDPRWVNALNFLDEASDRGLIKRDLKNARIGEVVIVQGPLKIRDFGSLKDIWKLPSVKKAMEAGSAQEPAGNRQKRRKASKQNTEHKKSNNPDLDMFLELIDILPHTTHAIVGVADAAWGLLKAEGLLGSSSDFALKFGGSIPGHWAMVGLLEGLPGESEVPADILNTTHLEQVGDALFMHLEPITRQLLGRPSSAYGVTPLIIMREVT